MKMVSASNELKDSRNLLLEQFSKGEVSENFQEEHTEIIDEYFRKSLQESETAHKLFRQKASLSFVATGGYGRRELCLYSDVDILILFDSKIPSLAKGLVKEIVFPLWDLGLEVGHATRTIKDSVNLSKHDFEALSSMMDSRFICGDSQLYLSLMESFEKKVLLKRAIPFRKWVDDRNKIRMERFGDASYLLEPHLKEGIGGLRDYHQMLWLGRILFNLRTPRDLEYLGKLSHKEYQDLENHLKRVWLVRNHLHRISGRKNDRLIFEYQETIANILRYEEQQDLLAVEQFMGKLHSSMSSIKSLYHSFFHNHIYKMRQNEKERPPLAISDSFYLYQDEIYFSSPRAILSNPFLLMTIFKESAQIGLPVSLEGKRLIKEFLYLVDDAFRSSAEAADAFLYILSSKNGTYTLDQMYETGLLEAFVPEFQEVRDRVHFDVYHIFPVGRHLLETVRYLKDLAHQKEILLLDILSNISKPEVVFLAGLLHDIGKSGRDHARKGVGISQKILNRLGLSKDKIQDILFLVRYHLLLVETATRRDLNDEKVVIQCARTIGDADRLQMLYLLTYADSKATGPKAWNGWISNLVQELFFKVLHILETGELANPDASRKVKETMARVLGAIPPGMDRKELHLHLDAMSPRYLLNTPPNTMVHHLQLVQRFQKVLIDEGMSGFILETREESSGFWEIIFLAKDKPGLFSDITGVLALHNINILSADIYTWRDSTAVDIFRVTSPLDPIHPHEAWERVQRDLKNTMDGTLSLPHHLKKKASPSIFSKKIKPSGPPKVIVDNTSSDFFTLIEVFAGDRGGLLYTITRTLFDLHLDIRIAKVATKGDLVADVFYVHDLEGQKVEDTERAEEIKKTLLHRLAMG